MAKLGIAQAMRSKAPQWHGVAKQWRGGAGQS